MRFWKGNKMDKECQHKWETDSFVINTSPQIIFKQRCCSSCKLSQTLPQGSNEWVECFVYPIGNLKK